MSGAKAIAGVLEELRAGLSEITEIGLEEGSCDCPPEWPRCAVCRMRQRSQRLERVVEQLIASPREACQTCDVSRAFHDLAIKDRNAAWTRAKMAALEHEARVEALRALLEATRDSAIRHTNDCGVFAKWGDRVCGCGADRWKAKIDAVLEAPVATERAE